MILYYISQYLFTRLWFDHRNDTHWQNVSTLSLRILDIESWIYTGMRILEEMSPFFIQERFDNRAIKDSSQIPGHQTMQSKSEII